MVLLPGALAERARAIAEGLHASFTLGVGQFCTNPGVAFCQAGPAADALAQHLSELTRSTPAAPMLSGRTCAAYNDGLERLQSLGATLLARGPEGEIDAPGQAALWQTEAASVLAEPRLLQEVFGPSTILVRYRDASELERLVRSMEGNLTASVHALPDEVAANAPLLRVLARKVGRVVFNQFPTGVEVNHAMVHGGPHPATSDGRSTSVGARAIERFSRLTAYQNAPPEGLPEELRDANPRGLCRLVDGTRTNGPVPARPQG
jgi:NADP-dependent aldehyde dehydrogenase